MSKKLPPLHIDDILIVHYIAKETMSPNESDIRTQMRLYGFPLKESLKGLIQKGYLVGIHVNVKNGNNEKLYKLSEAGRIWAGETFI